MALESIYWVALAAGVGLLVLSLLLDALGVMRLVDGLLGPGCVAFTALAAFGAAGLVGGLALGSDAASAFVAVIAAALLGGLAGLFYGRVRHQDALDSFERAKLIGMRGRAALAMGPGRVGRVTVQYAGMTRSLAATSQEEIRAGDEVVVLDVVGSSLTVERFDDALQRESKGEATWPT